MQLKNIFVSALALLGIHGQMEAAPSTGGEGKDLFREIVYSAKQTVFNLNAPTAVDAVTGATPQSAGRPPYVTLRIYDRGEGGKAVKTVRMKKSGDNRWTATVGGDLKGKFYTFDTSHGETAGVFARAVGVNGRRGAIIDLRDTDPAGWAQDVRPALKSAADLVIYEMHHRDFSIDASSGLEHKGKFLALTEPRAIAHLRALGVNAVHILPSFDYASVDETRLSQPQYNWGYDPLNYNVPEGSYSTYHIDGFRVDLMGVHDIETMNLIQHELTELDPTLFIYGEGWSAGTCAYPLDKLAVKAHTLQMPGIAAFSDDMRDALRGPFSDDSKGAFLAGLPGEEESLKFGIVGGIAHPQVDMSRVNYDKQPWAAEPTQQISYVSCHDDMCLVDRLRASIPGIAQDELVRLDLLAQTAVFTAQGIPFMLSGEEMLRDKKGVHNSFNSPDSINHLDWNNLTRYPQVFDYYSRLIQLRKNHPAFRLGTAERVRRHLRFLDAQPCVVAYALENLQGIDAWNDIVVVLNANRQPTVVTLPEGSYTVVCSDGRIDEQGLRTLPGGRVTVAAQSALILHK